MMSRDAAFTSASPLLPFLDCVPLLKRTAAGAHARGGALRTCPPLTRATPTERNNRISKALSNRSHAAISTVLSPHRFPGNSVSPVDRMTNTPPLLRRLQLLQPALPLFTTNGHSTPKIPSEQRTAAPRNMSYSFVVVPPPAPAATPAFEAHVSTLLRHVPHPTFITCTSYSPYFTSAAAEGMAAAPSGTAVDSANATETSATQQALSYLHKCVAADVGLVLTVTATRATCAEESLQGTEGGQQGSQQRPKLLGSLAPASLQPVKSLTGASRSGVAAVLADFHRRTSVAAAIAPGATNCQKGTRHRSRGLMVLRGDDGGDTRRRMASAQRDGASASAALPSPNPYADFADGVDLLRFISSILTSRDGEALCDALGGESDRAAMCLCVGGYPQGHVLDRQWGTTQERADAGTAAPLPGQSPFPYQTLSSLRFLEELDVVFADTEAQLRRAVGTPSAPRPLSVESCLEAAGALFARLDAVRRLWATPSSYPPDVRAACTHRTVVDKVLLRPSAAQPCVAAGASDVCHSTGACVVVTQMITSATEFLDYVEDVRIALRSSITTAGGDVCGCGNGAAAAEERAASGTSSPSSAAAAARLASLPSLVVVPGLMAPLRGEQYLRSTLQLKVMPSVPFQTALREYERALHSATETLRKAAAFTSEAVRSRNDAPTATLKREADDPACVNAIHMYQQAKEAAEERFQERMVDMTVAIVRDLRAHGYTHVNFSTFQYGCGDAVGRVVAALDVEGGEAVKLQ
ncbi:hypothetical protein LSCM4_06622 [Leishmania orientalis]|uniref:Uncharacterized protein n=1 Tax=Leishmania orientalis TaxID=2249476 RepID=A0A836H6H4_9TRYP|nr:hypothetical protein LSCM4_06622 [Leishmania orientalis]